MLNTTLEKTSNERHLDRHMLPLGKKSLLNLFEHSKTRLLKLWSRPRLELQIIISTHVADKKFRYWLKIELIFLACLFSANAADIDRLLQSGKTTSFDE